MKCWIKRVSNDDTKEFRGYFARNISKNVNHWVRLPQEAKLFTTKFRAELCMKKYNLKSCEIICATGRYE